MFLLQRYEASESIERARKKIKVCLKSSLYNCHQPITYPKIQSSTFTKWWAPCEASSYVVSFYLHNNPIGWLIISVLLITETITNHILWTLQNSIIIKLKRNYFNFSMHIWASLSKIDFILNYILQHRDGRREAVIFVVFISSKDSN